MYMISSKRKNMHRLKLQWIWALLAATIFVLPTALLGQAYFGSISGYVTDPAGAVIPKAQVTLVDQEKGFTFDAVTDDAGRYLFSAVPPGVYKVTTAVTGFDTLTRVGIHVDINQNVAVNLSLKVAGAVQTVKVGATENLNTEDATTGLVINRKAINDLPLIDRYAMDLTMLTPGVTETDDQCPVSCTGTNFISNGSRNSTADILTDGASVTNFEPNGGITNATYIPSPEAIDQFKVQQSNFSAEYGFSGASIVNMITRSGSNKFHGSVYDFIRNQITDANNWFNNYNGIPIAPIHRNNFGGTIGGPIIKNKTFFFFDFDGTLQSTMSTYQAGVPSTAERAGDFGEVCAYYGGTFDATGMCSVSQGQVWDPYSGTYDPNTGGAARSTFVPYNNLATYASPGSPVLNGTPYQLSGAPGDLIDPVALKMMDLFPQPNAAQNGIYDNWVGSGPSYNSNDQFDIKIDQQFSPKNLLSAKYSQDWNSSTPYNCFKNFTDPCSAGPNQAPAHLFSINDTETFSPTLLLNVTFGFTRGSERILAYNSQGVADPLSKLGFPSYLNSNGFEGVPTMFIGGGYYAAGNDGQATGTDPYGNYKQGQDTGQLGIEATKELGQTELKFGFEGRLHQMNYLQTNAPNGIFNFDQNGSSQCIGDVSCGGDGLATFLMGYADGGGYYEIQYQPATENFQYAGFVQDNWKAASNLTLNIGLRYDVSLPRTERHNRQNWFDPNVVSPLQVSGLGPLRGGEVFASSSQRTISNTDWKDIQPRFGFSWQFRQRWVVRGGYGIYYSQTRSGANGVGSYGTQGFNEYTNMVTTYQNDGATPYLHLSDPYPNGLELPPGNSLGLMNDVGFGAIGPIRTWTNTPYSQTWTLGIEHQLPWNVVVDAEYIGKKGTHLYFGGDNNLNILGPEIENYTPDQIAELNSYVNNPFYGVITDPNSTLSSPQVPAWQLQVPYPQFASATSDVPPIANSTYHSLQLTAGKNYSNGLQFFASFVWSKSIDDASVDDDNITWLGSFLSLQDPNKPWLERSLSTFDIPDVLQLSYSYDLPVGHGKEFFASTPNVVNAIIGGWKTNGIWRLNNGRPLPYSMYTGISLPTYGGQRPNLVGTPQRNHQSGWINNYLVNPDVFQAPLPYALGDTPRTIGSVRSPTAFNVDLSMEKDFSLEKVHNGTQLEFRLEAQNAFNHPVFGTPNTAVGSPDFGTITYTSNNPRQMQVGVKIFF